jgi:hypothetical protein
MSPGRPVTLSQPTTAPARSRVSYPPSTLEHMYTIRARRGLCDAPTSVRWSVALVDQVESWCPIETYPTEPQLRGGHPPAVRAARHPVGHTRAIARHPLHVRPSRTPEEGRRHPFGGSQRHPVLHLRHPTTPEPGLDPCHRRLHHVTHERVTGGPGTLLAVLDLRRPR